MCGICGELRWNHESIDSSILQRMTDTIRHRGPDSDGYFSGVGVGLGMRRLSIIDLSTGDQPIFNEDRNYCIVYNGELYNFLELRPELEAKGHVFKTRTDTEVILHAYEEWGVDCLTRFNGMFAFAIWNNCNRTLFLARDRIGEKPLYYYQDQDRLVFASEIKAILTDPTVPRQLNLRGMANFLAFGHAVAPETIYQNIYKLLPGYYLLAKNNQVQVIEYWDVGKEPQLPAGKVLTQNEYAAHILSLLNDSVRRRMLSDVPLGAFLSGGVDSSAIVSLMKKHSTGPVKTFSLGFAIGGAYNELSDARCVANYLGTEHHELQLEYVDLVKTLQTLVYHYDEPFGDAAGFPVYLISQFAREHVKVVLAGDGGDELFGGYRRYVADQFAPFYQRLPNLFTNTFMPYLCDHLPRLRRIKRSIRTLPIQDPARRYANWLILFSPEMQAELLNPDFYSALSDHDSTLPYSRYYANLNSRTAGDHLNRLMYMDLKTWLPDVYMEKVDKATMACSLEARLPLLDHRLVEFAFQIPSQYKISGLTTKRIFKQAVAHLLPRQVLRKPKHGFSVPTDPWFRDDLKSFTFEVLLDQRARNRGYFKMPVIERLWREHVNGRHVWDTHLWLLLNFELWHQTYLDGEGI